MTSWSAVVDRGAFHRLMRMDEITPRNTIAMRSNDVSVIAPGE
jgi:hypothetical protein